VPQKSRTRGERFTTPLGVKVPEITLAFWVIKVLTTGMGEAASDYLVKRLGGPVAVLIGFSVFALAISWQFSLKRYYTWAYWLAVVMVSVFGTMAADVLHLGLHIPYVASTMFYMSVLSVVFIVWYRRERTLSIHSITTTRREFFYWCTVLSTFALGTAAGDLTARTLHLRYAGSTFLFAALIAIPALIYWKTKAHPIFYFWFAYIVTRPLGASMADYLAVSHVRGGLNWGFGPVTLAWSGLIVVAVAYLAVSHHDEQRRPPVD
jgi:uncharacterized membrane-anchored protein